MKKSISLYLLLCAYFSLSAFNYQTVYSHRTLMFDIDGIRVEAIFIDSAKFQNDSILFPMRNIQLVGDGCYTPYGTSWLGNKIIINKKWNYFFNDENDTLKIKTDAHLNETWTLFKHPEVTITATLEKWDTCTVLGIKDSLKTIVLHVFDITMSPLPHKLEGRTIEISKHYGLVSSVNIIFFPTLKYNPFSYISDKFTLVGLTNPKLGIQNLTMFDAYDFQEGDEFHYTDTYNHLMFGGGAASTKKIIKILSRQNYSDSIKYVQNVETLSNFKQNSTTEYIASFNNEQANVVIRRDNTFDAYPGIPQFSNDSMSVLLNVMIGSAKTTDRNYYSKSIGDCWSKPMTTDDACFSVSYERGLGLVYSGGGCWSETYGLDEFKLVYYKKGSTTWGTPLVMTGLSQPQDKGEILIFPNPITELITINSEILTESCVFELMDLRGVVILKTELDANRNSVNIGNFRKGLYMYRLTNNGQLLKSGKVVKI